MRGKQASDGLSRRGNRSRTLVSASTSSGVSPWSRAETSGTYWSLRSRSSSCRRKEMPRTGPFWMRFIRWVVTENRASATATPLSRPTPLTSRNLVTEPLGRDHGDLIDETLVGAED